jgi:hypothetical protein
MANVEMADSDLAELKRIVMGGLRDFNVQVYLFGSYARGNAHRCSDIDVAVLPLEPLPPGTALQEFEQRFGMDSETFTSVLKRGLWGMIRISSNGRGSMSYPSIFCRRVNARGSGIPRGSLCAGWSLRHSLAFEYVGVALR